MPKRLWPGLAMLALGVTLVTTAEAMPSSRAKSGGVFRVAMVGASVQVDPQVSYVSTGWSLEYATAAKLYNYADKPGQAGGLLRPEVASGVKISRFGTTYTFTIRKGFRFSDGAQVTAKNFVYAFDRARSVELQSPASQFVSDVRSVIAKGDKLTIHLSGPDGAFLSRLTMPFFQATSTRLPLTREVSSVNGLADLPTAGPYAFSLNRPNEETRLVRNPYWKRGPGRDRPRKLAGLSITWNADEHTAYLQTLDNQYDEGPLPSANVEEVAQRFGVNKTRFWTEPISCVGYVGFNNYHGLFAGNAALRKAVNWGLDRTDYAAQAGPYAGQPWRHILPPGMPGSITAASRQPYAAKANLGTARELARGHYGSGKITILYRGSSTVGTNQAQLVRRDLIRLGFEPSNIAMRSFSGSAPYEPWMVGDWDLYVGSGACVEYPDPFGFFTGLLMQPGASPYSFDSPKYRKKINAAARLVGNARLRAFGKLDLEIMRNAAPVAPMRTYNNRFLFSDRVDPHSLFFQPVYSDWSIPALALK